MEGLLLVWINEKLMAGDSVGEAIICEKTKQLLEEVGAKAPSTSTGPVKEFFLAPRGGLPDLRKSTGLPSVVRHGEAAGGDREAAGQHREKFKKVIEGRGFVLQQVFNCDEAAQF